MELFKNKPWWFWVTAVVTIVLIFWTGGTGIFALPIVPLLLAGMSTDAGDVSVYVPFLIFIFSYLFIAVYYFGLVMSIRLLVKENKKKKEKTQVVYEDNKD